jgi:hypothetical protein
MEKKGAVTAVVTDAVDDESDPDALAYENFAGLEGDEDFLQSRPVQ